MLYNDALTLKNVKITLNPFFDKTLRIYTN